MKKIPSLLLNQAKVSKHKHSKRVHFTTSKDKVERKFKSDCRM